MHRLLRKPVLLSALAAAVAAGVLVALWPREPRYEGRPLSYWLDYLPVTFASDSPRLNPSLLMEASGVYFAGSPTKEEIRELQPKAVKAVNELGSRCLPLLLDRLRTKTTRFDELVYSARILVARLNHAKPPLSPQFLQRIKRGQAVTALRQLGEQAKPELPQLIALVKNEPDPNIRAEAGLVLRSISPPDYEKMAQSEAAAK